MSGAAGAQHFSRVGQHLVRDGFGVDLEAAAGNRLLHGFHFFGVEHVAAAAASGSSKAGVAMPAAAKLLAENNLSASAVAGTGKDGRVTKGDVLGAVAAGATKSVAAHAYAACTRSVFDAK